MKNNYMSNKHINLKSSINAILHLIMESITVEI